jgi:nitroreductase
MGQAFYLSTTALGIGCCGIGAFYDDEAARRFCLRANASLLYLLAAGPVRRW